MPNNSQNRYYDDYWTNQDWHPSARLSQVLRTCFNKHLRSEYSVLDLGCGDGQHYGMVLSSITRSHIGLDISGEALKEASRSGLKPCLWSGQNGIPFKDGSFDAAVCIEVLEHIYDPEEVVGEMYRVLKPGGTAIISVPNIAYYRERLLLLKGVFNPGGSPLAAWSNPWSDPHIRFFTPRTLKMLFIKMRFTVTVLTGDGGNPVGDLPVIAKMADGKLIFPGLAGVMQQRWPSLWGSKTILIATK